jgi:two-component system phosphate regulon sensor histidine kinase PhoR
MSPLLTIIAVAAAIGVHLYWSRRQREALREIEEQRREAERLRDRQELALEQAEAQRQALFNSMAEGFLMVDREGRVQAVNQALQRFFSIDGQAIGKTLMEVFRHHELLELWEQVQRDGQVRSFEFEPPGPQKRSFEISAAALRGRYGGQEGGIFIFHDLTRIKELENTRREFVANVSHELRTPLTLIKGFVETLQDGAKNDPTVADRFLGMIGKHADRLTFLIEDLLTISRLESGQIVLNMQPTRLAPLVDRILEDLESKARERAMKLRNEISADLEVHADGDRLQQTLLNLIDNAIKYGRSEGAVVVGAKGEDGKVIVWVKDDGPGIPAESLDRVFERFYRVDRARSREQGGTGLGLAIVKHIVQSHGGEVWVESVVGQGATFYFTLPSMQ